MSALLDAILEAAARRGGRTALEDGRNRIGYGQLAAGVAEMAEVIRAELGGRPGPVGLALDNGIDWVLADLALLGMGRPCIPIPPFFTDQQRIAALKDAGAVAMLGPNGIVSFAHAAAKLPASTAKISYTSGSTGTPKGICLSDALMLATARAVIGRVGEERAGVHLPLLPLAVLLENVAGLYATLLAGGRYHCRSLAALGLARLFDPSAGQMAAAIREAGASSLILVPELLARLVTEIEMTGSGLPSLELVAVGGAHVSSTLIERADRVGLPLVQGYGLTECGSVVAIERPGERGRGTVGTPLDHVAVTLADDGEVIVSGGGHLGTVGHPRTPGPIMTGDIGRLDEKGRLSIVGRKANLIITGFGRNIAPEWVEAALCAQPQIAQAMVMGEGEASLSALIVPCSPIADVAAAVNAANAGLPEYARIGSWRIAKPFLPAEGTLTPNGRLRRDAILAREASLPFFERLACLTAPARGRLLQTPQIQAGLSGRISRNTYLAYLAQAYHHVCHTVPLMRLAQSRLADRPRLVAALDEYIAEEEGHERWILNDIAAAGGDPDRAVAEGPSSATAAMVEHAYRVVGDGNAAGFFGMVFVLEGTSIALASSGADAVRTSLGLPAEAFTYLTSHGALDQDHMRFFEQLVNGLDDPADEAAIITMANDMFDLFRGVFAGIPIEDGFEAA